MASKVPVFSQIAWFSLIPQGILFGFFVFSYYLLGINFYLLFAALTYLAFSYGLKFFLIRNHKTGIKLIKQGNCAEAIPYFEKSVKYFSEKPWIDRYRYLTMLSSSRMSYREMGLCNIAFCYSQINQGQKAKKLYQSILKEYPKNILAPSALKMINSLENK